MAREIRLVTSIGSFATKGPPPDPVYMIGQAAALAVEQGSRKPVPSQKLQGVFVSVEAGAGLSDGLSPTTNP